MKVFLGVGSVGLVALGVIFLSVSIAFFEKVGVAGVLASIVLFGGACFGSGLMGGILLMQYALTTSNEIQKQAVQARVNETDHARELIRLASEYSRGNLTVPQSVNPPYESRGIYIENLGD